MPRAASAAVTDALALAAIGAGPITARRARWSLRLSTDFARLRERAEDLQSSLTRTYDTGQYDEVVDYSSPTTPRLRGEHASWARGLLRRRRSER